jgi:hypothetical protein
LIKRLDYPIFTIMRYWKRRLKRYCCDQVRIARARKMKQNRFPKGWDEGRVKRVLDHYENQTDDEAVAEDEAAWEDTAQTFIEVPNELVPAVRELLAKKVA